VVAFKSGTEIKLAFDIAKEKSNFSFIIPLTLTGDNSLFSTRNFIFSNFENTNFHCFPQKDIPSLRVFEDAKQSTLILIAEIDKSESNKDDKYIQVFTYPFNSFNDEKKYFKTDITSIKKFDPLKLSIPLVSENEWTILKKIHEAPPIRNIPEIKIRRGEINQTIFRKYISTDSTLSKLVKGVEIGPFKTNKKLSQGIFEYFDEASYLNDGKSNELKTIRRIATQRITGVDEKLRIVATIIEPIAYFADSTNSISTEEPVSLEYLLGILNSKLFQWRFKKTSSNNNVSTTELESLPFILKEDLSIPIEKCVKKILNMKKLDSNSETSQLEAQIDHLVYQLYGLTAEEIDIIENS
jgi:Alw26I/Eco31I/Esp3I family type II restriction m6 adenine DNA methyltransferase